MNEILDMNALVNYDSESNLCYTEIPGQFTGGDSYVYPVREWINYDWYINYYPCYYPVYEDKYKKAFNIAKLLLKNNWLISRKLKDFIGLVEEIAKEL